MIQKNTKNKIFNIALITLFIIAAFITFYPFWNVFIISLSEPADAMKGELYFWPRIFSAINYKTVLFENEMLATGLFNSVARTIIGTVANVFCSSMVAYALSRQDFIFRKFMNRYVVLTMYVAAGLIPTYMLYKKLGLINSFLVYIIPNLLSAYNIIILRSYMQEIPVALTEAAKVDGANDAQVFFKIIVPMSLPVLATVTLFVAVFQWSSWQDTFFYASNVASNGLTTLQYEMIRIINSTNASLSDGQIADMMSGTGAKPTPETLRAAITIIATVPILIVYPFLQRYFVNGVSMGAVKG